MERNKEKDGKEEEGVEGGGEERNDQHYNLKVSSLLILWILQYKRRQLWTILYPKFHKLDEMSRFLGNNKLLNFVR